MRALGAGTLPRDIFLYYVRQDALLVKRWTVLARAAAHDDLAEREHFAQLKRSAIGAEQAMHLEFLPAGTEDGLW